MRKHTTFPAVSALALCLALLAPLACGRRGRDDVADSTGPARAALLRLDASVNAPVAAAPPVTMEAVAAGTVAKSSVASDTRSESEPSQLGFQIASQLADVAPADGAMLIRHGDASVEVRRLDDALSTTRHTASQYGGFVANTAVRSGRDEQRSATLELRVPAQQFDALLGALNAVGKVESVNATAQDVGEEYADMGARAANARRVEARLAELLATRTGKLSDVLTVEQELARVREQIERYDARLRYLERHASLSTLSVVLHEPLPLIDRPRNGPIVDAIGAAWAHVIAIIAWCIASLGVIVPLGALIALGALLGRRVLRGAGVTSRPAAGVREA